MSFTLPAQSNAFYQEVVERCFSLIELNYWNRIDNYTLRQWLSNFDSDEEKYFAAQLLFHFQYRNEKAIISMFKQIIQAYLPQKLDELGIYKISSIREWEYTLKTEEKAYKLPFRFTTINKEGRIGESGDALFRTIAQYNIVYKGIGRFINCIDTDKIKTVILIDDITGSGDQFKKFYAQYIDTFEQFEHIIYCPLVAHEAAIKNISEISPKIHIIPAEIITTEHSFYGISDEKNSTKDFLNFYEQLISKNKLKITFRYGYNAQAILYGMDISTPNNNHPLIYHNRKWNPLLIR